jgi:leucine dehydrogenase
MRLIAEETRHVAGIADAAAVAAGRTGDPSPATAMGVFIGIRAAVRFALDRDELKGLKIAIQGVGNVGGRLARHLAAAGAELYIADVHAPTLDRCAQDTGASIVPLDIIHSIDADVFAPCALGASINDMTLPALRARVVAGAANNQLAEPRHGEALRNAGILYAPDYVINAGGIIDIYYEGPEYDAAIVQAHLERIGATLTEIFERSEVTGQPTGEVADRLAEERFRRG